MPTMAPSGGSRRRDRPDGRAGDVGAAPDDPGWHAGPLLRRRSVRARPHAHRDSERKALTRPRRSPSRRTERSSSPAPPMPNNNSDFALARYLPNGGLDTSFEEQHSEPSRVITDARAEGHDEVHAIALQPDGKIVVAGFSSAPNGEANFALVGPTPMAAWTRASATTRWSQAGSSPIFAAAASTRRIPSLSRRTAS